MLIVMLPKLNMNLFKCRSIRVNEKLNDAPRALELLRRVAYEVEPIIRKHSFVVGDLSEMSPGDCPENVLGDNLNFGERIRIRLRDHNGQFYDYEDLIGTMLHELAHNVVGPHNTEFHALLETLNRELEENRAKGIRGGSGSGFDAPGAKVGGRKTTSNAPLLRRERCACAAEKRFAQRAMNFSRQLGDDTCGARIVVPRTIDDLREQRMKFFGET